MRTLHLTTWRVGPGVSGAPGSMERLSESDSWRAARVHSPSATSPRQGMHQPMTSGSVHRQS